MAVAFSAEITPEWLPDKQHLILDALENVIHATRYASRKTPPNNHT
jgi:hypothetical protein